MLFLDGLFSQGLSFIQFSCLHFDNGLFQPGKLLLAVRCSVVKSSDNKLIMRKTGLMAMLLVAFNAFIAIVNPLTR
jgi:hypothetical protein